MSSNALHAILAKMLLDIEAEVVELQKIFESSKMESVRGNAILENVFAVAISSYVSKIYTKAEFVFSKIAEKIDRSKPGQDGWHSELLLQMSVEINGDEGRPRFLSEKSLELFNHLRKFRHFERNNYASEIAAGTASEKVEIVIAAAESLRADFDTFSERYFEIAAPAPERPVS